jgi:hypothetical protein
MRGPMITLIMAKKKAAGPGGYFDTDEEPEEMEAEDSEETEEEEMEDEEEEESEPKDSMKAKGSSGSPDELRAMAEKLMAHADKMDKAARAKKSMGF